MIVVKIIYINMNSRKNVIKNVLQIQKKSIFIVECPIEYPYEIVELQECVQNCIDNDIKDKKCIVNYENLLLNENGDEALGNTQENMINGNYNLTDLDKGEEIVYKNNETSIKVTTSNKIKNDENNNETTIDLGGCESILRNEYHIPKNKSIYILEVEVKEKGMKIPKIEYEVYYPFNGINLEKLDLIKCANTTIDISHFVNINSKDIDKHDSKSNYYNDICYTSTTEKGTDITLEDRKKEFIKNNYTLCEEDCELTKYDSKTKKALCSCKVKIQLPLISEISFDKSKLYDSFSRIKNFGNFKIMKCYKVLFTKEGMIKNIGCYIIFPIILLHFISIIIFYFKDYKDIQKIINDILEALKYLFVKDNINNDNKKKRRKSTIHKNNIIKNKLISEEKNVMKNKNII